jgi:hypothetical protein
MGIFQVNTWVAVIATSGVMIHCRRRTVSVTAFIAACVIDV